MPDELKPCPWPGCGSSLVGLDFDTTKRGTMFHIVYCEACDRCVVCDSEEKAIASWNALSRLTATIYDGTDATLPQKGEIVFAILYGSDKGGLRLRSVSGWAGVKHHVVTDGFCRGDTWWPLPGG